MESDLQDASQNQRVIFTTFAVIWCTVYYVIPFKCMHQKQSSNITLSKGNNYDIWNAFLNSHEVTTLVRIINDPPKELQKLKQWCTKVATKNTVIKHILWVYWFYLYCNLMFKIIIIIIIMLTARSFILVFFFPWLKFLSRLCLVWCCQSTFSGPSLASISFHSSVECIVC